jgi:hypothetical protein
MDERKSPRQRNAVAWIPDAMFNVIRRYAYETRHAQWVIVSVAVEKLEEEYGDDYEALLLELKDRDF